MELQLHNKEREEFKLSLRKSKLSKDINELRNRISTNIIKYNLNKPVLCSLGDVLSLLDESKNKVAFLCEARDDNVYAYVINQCLIYLCNNIQYIKYNDELSDVLCKFIDYITDGLNNKYIEERQLDLRLFLCFFIDCPIEQVRKSKFIFCILPLIAKCDYSQNEELIIDFLMKYLQHYGSCLLKKLTSFSLTESNIDFCYIILKVILNYLSLYHNIEVYENHGELLKSTTTEDGELYFIDNLIIHLIASYVDFIFFNEKVFSFQMENLILDILVKISFQINCEKAVSSFCCFNLIQQIEEIMFCHSLSDKTYNELTYLLYILRISTSGRYEIW